MIKGKKMRFSILFFIFVNLAYSLSPFDLHNVSKAHGQNITGAGIEIQILETTLTEAT